jgi:iron complex outermembrane receptor protein
MFGKHGARRAGTAARGFLALTAVAAGPTWADTPPDGAAIGTLDEVVVTGSRLALGAAAAALPLTTLDSADLARGGRDSLGEILQSLPQNTGSPLNTNVNNGGDGSVRLSLRGLSPERTLVLLNGHRFPNGGLGGDAAVDLTSIPLSLVERVEVLNAGATAIYGADAVAGVVNLITRRPAPGFAGELRQARTDRGDGNVTTAQLAGGLGTGEGAWTLGLDYVRQDGVLQSRREYSAIPLEYASTAGTRGPNLSPATGDGLFFPRPGNVLGLTPFIPVTHVGDVGSRAADNYAPFVLPRDGFNYAPYNWLQTPNERGGAWLLGAQPLGAAEFYFEGLWQRRTSSQKLAPSPLRITPGQVPVLPDGNSGIPADNWYNPFGVAVRRGARRLVEADDRGFAQRVDLWRTLAGLRGDRGAWHWDVSVSFARAHGRSTESGAIPNDRVIAALGPSGPDASGRIVCGRRDPATGRVPDAAVIPGCVPLDLFGGAGSITPEQIDYLQVPLRDGGLDEQRLVEATVSGSAGRLPAGDVQWALGAEYRRESGRYVFDPFRRSGLVGDVGSDIPGGQFSTRELYVESRLPLLASAGLGRIGATFGARHLDYTSFGSGTPWQLALDWALPRAWSVRAGYGQVLRAPSLAELYSSRFADYTDSLVDPCSAPTPVQRTNCAANGVPGGSYVRDPDQLTQVVSGGNPALRPERGSSANVGLAWRDERTSLSLDAFRVDVGGYVETLDPQAIVYECANRGTAAACAAISRLPDGTLDSIAALPRNFGRIVTEGLDHAGRVRLDAGGGAVALRWSVSWVSRFDLQAFDGGPVQRGAGRYFLGQYALPRWRATASADWSRGPWRASWGAQYVGRFGTCTPVGTNDPPDQYCYTVGSALYHDLDAAYRLRDGLTVRAGVQNVGNVSPPFLSGGGANTDPASYRLVGRRYFLAIGLDWR